MTIFFRSLPLVLAASLMLPVSSSMAQSTTLKLTTAQQQSCVATTDVHGVQLEAGTSALVATGVQLSGDCGAAAENYQVAVTVPGSATVGVPFNVVWSAGPDATHCTYGGSAGVTGWNTGAQACSGTSCQTPHTASVTVNQAGAHAFSITCTNSSGHVSKSVTASVPPTPPSPNGFVLTPSPASGFKVGVPFNVQWQVSGATSCAGTATKGGVAAQLPGWTEPTTTSSPRTVTPAEAGNWKLKLNCANAHGNAISQELVVDVATETKSCPADRMASVRVCYNFNLNSSSCVDVAGDMTFDQIWGRGSPAGAQTPFPSLAQGVIFTNFDRNKYLSVKVPAGQLPEAMVGYFFQSETYSGPQIKMTISTECGDFTPPNPACAVSNVGPEKLVWYRNANNPLGRCPMASNQDYYLNFKSIGDPLKPSDCNGSICKMAIHNYP